MLRAVLMPILATMLAARAAPTPVDSAAAFVGIDGKPLVLANGDTDAYVLQALTASPAASGGQPAPGRCAPANNPCGCNQRIVDGVALPALCVD